MQQVLLHFYSDTVTISKERYYRLLEIEEQYQAQQEETRRLHQLLEEVIHRFEDDPKVIHLRDYLYKRSA
jgi:histone deacetylase complex regulatory component SIN3